MNSKRGRDYAHSLHAGELEARLFFSFNFKRTISQKEHNIIFSGLKINEMALSDQSDFRHFPNLLEFNQFRKMTIRCCPCSVRWLYAAKFEKIDFPLTDCRKSK
jgi:hypothetical protein